VILPPKGVPLSQGIRFKCTIAVCKSRERYNDIIAVTTPPPKDLNSEFRSFAKWRSKVMRHFANERNSLFKSLGGGGVVTAKV